MNMTTLNTSSIANPKLHTTNQKVFTVSPLVSREQALQNQAKLRAEQKTDTAKLREKYEKYVRASFMGVNEKAMIKRPAIPDSVFKKQELKKTPETTPHKHEHLRNSTSVYHNGKEIKIALSPFNDSREEILKHHKMNKNITTQKNNTVVNTDKPSRPSPKNQNTQNRIYIDANAFNKKIVMKPKADPQQVPDSFALPAASRSTCRPTTIFNYHPNLDPLLSSPLKPASSDYSDDGMDTHHTRLKHYPHEPKDYLLLDDTDNITLGNRMLLERLSTIDEGSNEDLDSNYCRLSEIDENSEHHYDLDIENDSVASYEIMDDNYNISMMNSDVRRTALIRSMEDSDTTSYQSFNESDMEDLEEFVPYTRQ